MVAMSCPPPAAHLVQEFLGELPVASDQAQFGRLASSAIPQVFRCDEDYGFSWGARQNEQLVWATLGCWDL